MTTTNPSRDSEPVRGLQDYLAISRRRRTLTLLVGGSLLVLVLAAAFLWPASYKSTATILIEEQEVPTDLVHSTITSYADQRIETIKQQVLSRTTLWKVVEQYNLYADLRRTNPAEEVVKQFIKDIDVAVISADVVNKRTNTQMKATIAFTVSYQSESPVLAQKVANELTSLFLGQNLKSRERQAQEATTFLQQEADSLSAHINEVDDKIAAFKQKASGALPELMQLNLQLLNQTDRELMDIDQQIRSLEERKTYLEGELATIKPNTPIMAVTGERILDSADRLRSPRAEYAGASANLAPDHPDIVKTKQEIKALEKETGQAPEVEEAVKQLGKAKADLATASKRLGSDDPDVVKARRTIQALELEVKRLGPATLRKPMLRPEPPAYIYIQAQLNSITSSLDSLKTSRKSVKERLRDYTTRIERTPEMEPDYLALTRDLDTSGQTYQDIRSRLLEAKVSEGLEVQRKGERFPLIDPPGLPEKPDEPNRPAIVLLGFILALAGGIGAGATAETLDRSIRSPEQIAQLTQLFPLAVIPFMPNERDLSRAVRRRWLLKGAGVGALVTIFALLHVFVMPLDVLWFAALRRFGID